MWWSQPALKSRPVTLSSRIHHEVRTGSLSWLACLTHGQPRVVARRRTRSPLLPCAADLVCCELTFAAYRVCCEPPWKEKLTVLGRYAGLEPGKRYSGGTCRGWRSLGGPGEDHRCGEEGPSPKKSPGESTSGVGIRSRRVQKCRPRLHVVHRGQHLCVLAKGATVKSSCFSLAEVSL